MKSADLSLPILTIRQPWAWLVVAGIKDIENRSWLPPAGVTRFLVHAAVAGDKAAWAEARAVWDSVRLEGLFPSPHEVRFGAIIGAVDFIGDSTSSRSPWARPECRHHWALRNAESCTPVPCRGRLGFWRWTPEMGMEQKDANGTREEGKSPA